MKYDQFSITQIELTHDQALELKQKVIDTIENYGIENFEKKKEIELPDMCDDPINVYVTCEIYQEFSGSFQQLDEPPQAEKVISQSIMILIISMYNEQGDEVRWTVLGSKEYTQIAGQKEFRWFTRSPIDIEEEIKDYFLI